MANAQQGKLPERIGKYVIKRLLGKGGMGRVYHAYDPFIGRDVALKVMLPDLAEDRVLKERFIREAQSAGRLRHPNIVTIYDLGEENGVPYIAMEYLEGRDLDEIIRKRLPISLEEKLDIIRQACEALAYAHAHGIVHRDIKPANIRVLDDGVVKIMDFGIAKMGATHFTQTGIIMGTPHYMAPEQIRGERDKIGPHTDIFSLGVVLYELLAYKRPFQGEHYTTVFYKIVHEPPEPLDESLAIPHLDEIRAIVEKAIAKRIEDRYASAQEMAQAIQHILDVLRSERETLLTETRPEPELPPTVILPPEPSVTPTKTQHPPEPSSPLEPPTAASPSAPASPTVPAAPESPPAPQRPQGAQPSVSAQPTRIATTGPSRSVPTPSEIYARPRATTARASAVWFNWTGMAIFLALLFAGVVTAVLVYRYWPQETTVQTASTGSPKSEQQPQIPDRPSVKTPESAPVNVEPASPTESAPESTPVSPGTGTESETAEPSPEPRSPEPPKPEPPAKETETSTAPPPVEPQETSPPVAPPLPPGQMYINILPWARIEEIRRVSDGTLVNVPQPPYTPLWIPKVPPGRYRIRYSHPALGRSETIEVTVASGRVATVEKQLQSIIQRLSESGP